MKYQLIIYTHGEQFFSEVQDSEGLTLSDMSEAIRVETRNIDSLSIELCDGSFMIFGEDAIKAAIINVVEVKGGK